MTGEPVETPRWGVSANATPREDTTRYKGYRAESARLRGWDYRTNAYYFVTICTRNRQHTLGEVVANELILSPAGVIAEEEWRRTADLRPEIEIDTYVIMPNHLHGIIVIRRNETSPGTAAPNETPQRGVSTWAAGSLGAIINQFKGASTKRIRATGISEFGWQPRFYDHIIRDEDSLNRIREYIAGNPLKWDTEQDAPENLWM